MAHVRERNGIYTIIEYLGRDSNGKRHDYSETFKPAPGMGKREIKKELNKRIAAVEEKCRTGLVSDSDITLSEFIDQWFNDYGEKRLKEKSIKGYLDTIPRIKQALGHMRIDKITPRHIIAFCNNLAEPGVRMDTKYTPTVDFKALLKKKKMTQAQLSEKAGVSITSIRSCINGHNVSKTTADKISAALNDNSLFKAADSNGTLSNATIIKHLDVLSSIMTSAVQWQIIPNNPCANVPRPKLDYKEAAVLDEYQARQIIKALQNEPLRYRTLITLLLCSGIRSGEATGLTWDDIDFESGVIDIHKTRNYTVRKGVYEDTPKSKSSIRYVGIAPYMISLLEQYKAEQEILKAQLGDRWEGDNHVFVSDMGRPLHPDTPGRWYRKFVNKYGLTASHLHTLRHTMTTLLANNGIDDSTLSKRLGHSNPSITRRIYTHVNRSADMRAANKIEELLFREDD